MISAVAELLGSGWSCETPLDWQTIRREGLLGLSALHQLETGGEVPAEIRLVLNQAVAFEMSCGAILKEVGRAAAARGISLLTFKGCALAFGLYPRAGQRAFGDIDLAVRPGDWQATVDMLQEMGFVLSYGCLFTRQGITVDLHRHPLHQLARLVGPRCQEWWESAVPLSERTGPVLRLAHQHEFVLGLFHSAKHSFARSGWVVDLALLAQHVDPSLLCEVVVRYRTTRQLAFAAECLEVWFGQSLPQPLDALASRRWNVAERRFMGLVLQRKAPDFLGMLTPLASAPSLRAGLEYLVGSLYPPGTPVWGRTRQLWEMLRRVLTA